MQRDGFVHFVTSITLNMVIINFILAVLFWFMVDEAVADDRYGWGFTYLFISAMNGAAVLADIF